MEQYELDGRTYERSIQTALAHYRVTRVFIRDCGSGWRWMGETKYRRELIAGDKFGMVSDKRGFSVQVNGEEVFFFAVERLSGGMWWGKKWAVGYENPDNETPPKIKFSILRSVNFRHLIEVTFAGKIHLKRTRVVAQMPDRYKWQIIPPPQ